MTDEQQLDWRREHARRQLRARTWMLKTAGDLRMQAAALEAEARRAEREADRIGEALLPPTGPRP